MRRRALASVLAAIGVLGAPAAGCKKEHKAPFFVPPSARDSGTDGMPHPGRGGDDGGGAALLDAGAALPDAGAALPDAGAALPDAGPPAGCDGGLELHVLFIGNSHTYTNDLPGLIRELACAAGTKLVSQQVTPGGVGFVEHSTSADTLAAIEADAWDFVVMQDQQQRPGYRLEEVERDHVPAAQILVDAIRAHRKQTRPLFYMVWARRDGDTQNCEYYPLLCSFEDATRAVSDGYRLYAERTRADLAPVALAWATVQADVRSPVPGAQLWMDDGSHPALPGSYLAAAVLVRTMLQKKTAKLTYAAGLEAKVAGYLRGIADRIVAEEQADVRVTTAERVGIACEFSDACSESADAAEVTFALSAGSCKDLTAGAASIDARLQTHASCRTGQCQTVALGEWHAVRGGAIADGAYQVLAHVDVNANGDIDEGDLVACTSANFEVGSGEDLTFDQFDVR